MYIIFDAYIFVFDRPATSTIDMSILLRGFMDLTAEREQCRRCGGFGGMAVNGKRVNVMCTYYIILHYICTEEHIVHCAAIRCDLRTRVAHVEYNLGV